MTLEELAVVAQHEFESLRRDMATKEELRAAETNILRAIEGVDRHLLAHSSYWGDQVGQLDHRLQRIDKRVTLLECSHVKEDLPDAHSP
jgi:hypothetical protein